MKQEKNSGSKLVPIVIFAVVIFAVAMYGFLFLRHDDDIIQGEAEVTEINISSMVTGRIEKFFVEEGSYVKKGDTLAILSIPVVDAKLYQAESAKAAAKAQSEKADAGTRSEMKQSAYEMWQKAIAGKDIAQKTYDRAANLYKKGVVTAQKYDEAQANLQAMIATEKAAKAQYDLALKGAQWEDKVSAAALENQAKGAVAEVESLVKESYLIAPIDGRISEKYPHESELVGAGSPILSIADLTDKWASFNISENRLPKYKIGEKIKAFVPALDKEVELHIYYMKDLGTYAAWKATKPLGQYDRKVFEVRARFYDTSIDVLPGMSVIIRDSEKK